MILRCCFFFLLSGTRRGSSLLHLLSDGFVFPSFFFPLPLLPCFLLGVLSCMCVLAQLLLVFRGGNVRSRNISLAQQVPSQNTVHTNYNQPAGQQSGSMKGMCPAFFFFLIFYQQLSDPPCACVFTHGPLCIAVHAYHSPSRLLVSVCLAVIPSFHFKKMHSFP